METLAALAPVIWGAVSLGAAWIAKEIFKPWSDAWRMKIVAESEHLRKVDEALVLMVHDSKRQTDSLAGIDEKMTQNNETLAQMRKDSAGLCKAGDVVTRSQFDELIKEIKVLQNQGKDAAKALEDKAVLIATIRDEPPKG